MKINFLIPPAKNKVPERIYGCSYQIYAQPELPILYCAAILQKFGHKVDFKDFTLEDNSWESFNKYIVARRDCQTHIFHSVLLSKDIDLKAAKEIRKLNKNAFIIFFGPEPTRIPEEFILDDKFFVIRGEPEITIKNLAEILSKNLSLENIKGISWSRLAKIVHNPSFGIIENLDELPFPARNLTKRYESKYYNAKIPKRPHQVILTSRGCAFRCYFCVPNSISWARELEWKKYHNNQKPPPRLRSAENIIKEFKELAKEGYKSIWVLDDMFLWGKERSMNILKGIKGLDVELGILARADFIDKNIAELLREANCKIVDMGVESFDQETLDYIKKDLKVESVYKAIDILKKEKIIPEINLMFGVSPLDTKEKIKATIKKAIDLDVKYALFSIATPFPGTELQEMAEKGGWLIKEKYNNLITNLDPSSKGMLSFPNLSAKDLEGLVKYAKRKFYFRPKYVWWRAKQIRSFSEFIILVKTVLKLLE